MRMQRVAPRYPLQLLRLIVGVLRRDWCAIDCWISLAPGSFDSRRECAIEVRDEDVVDRLHEITHADWKNSHPLHLTDEGLLAELEDFDGRAAEDLAIGSGNSSEGEHNE